MIKNKYKVALVVDEFGGMAGKITIDDILEEVVGEIHHMPNNPKLPIVEQISENVYRLQAGLSLNDWEDLFDSPLEMQKNYGVSSIGGFVICLLEKLPQKGDTAVYKNLIFTVEEMDKKRIKTLILTISDQK